MLKKTIYITALLLFFTHLKGQGTIEVTVSGDTSLALYSMIYSISVQDQYTLPDNLSVEEMDEMNTSIKRKNTEQFDKFLQSKGIKYYTNVQAPFSLGLQNNGLSKSYFFTFYTIEELRQALSLFNRFDFLSGGIHKIEFNGRSKMEHALWAKLFQQALSIATSRSSVAKGRIGKLIEANEPTVEVLGPQELSEPSDSACGKLTMTARFKFELL